MAVVLQIDARRLIDTSKTIRLSATNKDHTRALNAAINRTGDAGVVQVKKSLREATDVKADRLNKALAISRSSFENLRYVVKASGRPLPLAYFDVRQGKRGVSARAWGRRTLFRGTFLATMPSGHMGVFRRSRTEVRRVKRYDKRGRVYYSQLPIIELAGPSIPRAMTQAAVVQAFENLVKERLPREYAHEIERVVNGWGQKKS